MLAVPVAPRDAVDAFAALADEVVVLAVPRPFIAVGHRLLGLLGPTSDAEVIAALDAGARP